MNEEYLWNKTGEDAEIERLETTLAAFRYQETAVPALPSKILVFQSSVAAEAPVKTSRRRSFKNFALAAFAAAILLAFAVFWQFQSNQTATISDSAKTSAPEKSNETQQFSVSASEKPEINLTERAEIALQPDDSSATRKPTAKFAARPIAVRVLGKTRRSEARISGKNETFARRTEFKKPNDALTAEEKNAYEQLLLALSITGEKLKIVQDKIDRSEEKHALITDRK